VEQEFDPYPEHLEIRCHSFLLENDPVESFSWEPYEYGYSCEILDRYTLPWPSRTSEPGEQATDDGFRYDVRIHAVEDDSPIFVERTEVVRSALAFFDATGTTDIHLPHAFRHPIGIPDDMVPDAWRDS
jgi:hypothetical protein